MHQLTIFDFNNDMPNSFRNDSVTNFLKLFQGIVRCNIIILLLALFMSVSPSYSALKGGVGYQIPIDYSKLNAVEMAEKADFYFNNIMLQESTVVDENMTSVLNLYTMLADKSPQNTLYPLRLGILYDRIGKDRYAKGNFYRAIGINNNIPEPYFYLGEFFFKRQNYRRALKMYLTAYNKGYSQNAKTLERLAQIYTMFGDLDKARMYVSVQEK